jgi:hypothetical protein
VSLARFEEQEGAGAAAGPDGAADPDIHPHDSTEPTNE